MGSRRALSLHQEGVYELTSVSLKAICYIVKNLENVHFLLPNDSSEICISLQMVSVALSMIINFGNILMSVCSDTIQL